MTYKPNWCDRRTRQRAHQIILWVERYIGSEQRCLHSKILRSKAAFGDSELGRYLRSCLLIKTSVAYKQGEFSQQYTLNNAYLNYLRDQLGMPARTLPMTSIERRFQEQAAEIHSGEFEYTEVGGRWYNGLQLIPRDVKPLFWQEYSYLYDYDIDTCAPTLLYQQAKKIKSKIKPLAYVEFYINHKQEVRDELMIKYNLSGSQVKQIINALFQGGILNSYEHNKILRYVNMMTYKIAQLKQDQFLVALIKDIKAMWSVLRGQISTGYTYQGDQRRSRRITGKHKTNYYKQLEGEVMSVVWRSLRRNGIKFFKEHDGFRSDQFVIPCELEQEIWRATGFDIKFKWSKVDISQREKESQ